MPLRPIDMQSMLPKVAKVHQAKMKVIHREDIENQNGADNMAKSIDIKRQSVNQTNKSEHSKFKSKKDGESDDENKKDNENNNAESNQDSDKKEDDMPTIKHIDLRI